MNKGKQKKRAETIYRLREDFPGCYTRFSIDQMDAMCKKVPIDRGYMMGIDRYIPMNSSGSGPKEPMNIESFDSGSAGMLYTAS